MRRQNKAKAAVNAGSLKYATPQKLWGPRHLANRSMPNYFCPCGGPFA
ncbi:hypothetical protein P378_10575 [Desulforamulus profundi]|uniref:Uncharacterized protein n=1 Tax=Desulforamulus profundi TaxID=1383067 RepID=A0A2C6MDT3_9FIRM|nr:hypothetical protein [Desulforamulus profundi]PHJ38268.1 hypothetical protein P378_10575 [Desulforamulus profundi]